MCVRMAMYIPHTLWYDRGEPAAGQQYKTHIPTIVVHVNTTLSSNQPTLLFLVVGASNRIKM